MKKTLLIIFCLAFVFAFFGTYTPVSAQKDQIKLKVFEHYPKNPGKPTPISYCTLTSDAEVDHYGWAGWQMPDEGLNYSINFNTKPKNLTDTQIQTAIDNSFATWTEADSNQIFIDIGSTSAKNPKYDSTNAILFKSIRSGAIAITYVWYYLSTGELVETDTVFNSRYKWSINDPSKDDCAGQAGTYDVQNIGTHEFGHWIGLDDLYNSVDKDLTMYGYGDLQELKKDSLGLGDITGVNSILP